MALRFTPTGVAGIIACAACVASVLTAPLAASGDTVVLSSGATIEGAVLSRSDDGYRVRTSSGIVTVPLDSVARIDSPAAAKSSAEYSQRAAQAADSPADQTALAEWCLGVGLRGEAQKHFRRAIQLDPEHEAARGALGHVRVGDSWIDGRTSIERLEPPRESKARRPVDDQKLIAAIQTQWTLQLRAIRAQQLDSGNESSIRSAREKVLGITDPLAIAPLTRALCEGSLAARTLLVEALGRFTQDESTLNLAMIALCDASADVRRAATVQLARRGDLRVVGQLRKALQGDNDVLIERAAVALGTLKARAAIPELIDCLTAQRRKTVEVPASTLFGQMPSAFDQRSTVALGPTLSLTYTPQLAVAGSVTSSIFKGSTFEQRDVTVFRTAVLESLRQITGQDFGFDAASWRRWYEETRP